jgi:hypothetical protein
MGWLPCTELSTKKTLPYNPSLASSPSFFFFCCQGLVLFAFVLPPRLRRPDQTQPLRSVPARERRLQLFICKLPPHRPLHPSVVAGQNTAKYCAVSSARALAQHRLCQCASPRVRHAAPVLPSPTAPASSAALIRPRPRSRPRILDLLRRS